MLRIYACNLLLPIVILMNFSDQYIYTSHKCRQTFQQCNFDLNYNIRNILFISDSLKRTIRLSHLVILLRIIRCCIALKIDYTLKFILMTILVKYTLLEANNLMMIS